MRLYSTVQKFWRMKFQLVEMENSYIEPFERAKQKRKKIFLFPDIQAYTLVDLM